jgi:hypothetical protein
MRISLLKKNEIIDFIEFNITGDAENYVRCDDESYYLQANIFNILPGALSAATIYSIIFPLRCIMHVVHSTPKRTTLQP